MAFKEPFSLRWTSVFDFTDLPDLEREDPTKVVACISDWRGFYHQIAVSPSRSCSNKLWPPLPLKALEGTQAYSRFLEAPTIEEAEGWKT